MILVVAISLAGLLMVLTALELSDRDDTFGWASRPETFARIARLRLVAEDVEPSQTKDLLDIASRCHSGFTVTAELFPHLRETPKIALLRSRLARDLQLEREHVRIGYTRLTRDDFSYHKCRHAEIGLPLEGIVFSVRLRDGRWLNAEIHPHEWHVADKVDWLVRSGTAFLIVGGIAVFFMRRIGAPLRRLTDGAKRFGSGLRVVAVPERGPPDLRRAIVAFNAMQRHVAEEVERRTHTLAAISHDVRTPLTALRIKAELITDDAARADLITSIDQMEAITASALAYLRGDANAEAIREIDLSAMLESECDDFERVERRVRFKGVDGFRYPCRSDALARAVRNLIDNAVKYGGGADVELRVSPSQIEIIVSDQGPGIAPEDRARVIEPFERLSEDATRPPGGFGLGLAVVEAITRGHGGSLRLTANAPQGLVATIQLPVRSRRPVEQACSIAQHPDSPPKSKSDPAV